MTSDNYEPPTLESIIEAIHEAQPSLSARQTQTIRGLANLYRMLAYHEHTLITDPANSYAGDQYQKLRTLALRHEVSLGIAKGMPEGDEPRDPRPNARRGRE